MFGIVLLAFGLSDTLTHGDDIVTSFDVPHMLLVIFVGGLVVQYRFSVTLVTMAAVATLWLFDSTYTWVTELYFFSSVSIGAQVFLGMHLLITDPATSPQTNAGRVLYAIVYALCYVTLYRLLGWAGLPLYWDKLLPVPILNLCVPFIDRAVRGDIFGTLGRRWDTALTARNLNLVHIGCWIALFSALMSDGSSAASRDLIADLRHAIGQQQNARSCHGRGPLCLIEFLKIRFQPHTDVGTVKHDRN